MTDLPVTLANYAAAIERLKKSGLTIADIHNLAEKVDIALERARVRGTPQEIHIMVNRRAFVDYINMSDNYPRHGEDSKA